MALHRQSPSRINGVFVFSLFLQLSAVLSEKAHEGRETRGEELLREVRFGLAARKFTNEAWLVPTGMPSYAALLSTVQ
jgi:hypothetical protein